MIPTQLQNPDFRFILVKPEDKKPIENYWQCSTLAEAQTKWESETRETEKEGKTHKKPQPTTITQYTYDNQKLKQHLQEKGNIGVVCGQGGLIVVDIDKKDDDMQLFKTLTIQTPSEGIHQYLICPQLQKKLLLEVNGIHYGEIQAGGNTQVLCPPSKARSKKTGEVLPYVILEDLPIKKVTLEELTDNFGRYYKTKTSKITPTPYFNEKYELNIESLVNLKEFTKRGQEYQGPHPVHGSTQGNNFCINTNKNVWHCFRHDCGGGPLELLAMMEGIIHCGDKLSSQDFNLTIGIAEKKYGMQRKKPVDQNDLKIQVLGLLAMNKMDEATEIVVDEIKRSNHIYTMRDDKNPEIWIYRDGIYTPHGRTYIEEFCRDIISNAFSRTFVNNVVAKIQADTYTDPDKFFKLNTGDWICIKNGLFNPMSRELKDFDPKQIHFTKINVSFDPNADCPNIKKHFREVVASEDDVMVLEEISGWFLLNEYKPERAIMLNGHGRNGKGKTILLWQTFLGNDSISSVSLQEFSDDQYAASDLLNKRANLAGDVSNKEIVDTGLFKKITGEDPISANRKYLSRIQFFNNAKMVCACNEIPYTKDMSDGFFSRWVLVDFPYRFITDKEKGKLTDEDIEKIKIADLDIINKLTTDEELSGLLNLACIALDRLLKNKDFSTTRTTYQVKAEWIKRSDSFKGFATEYLKEEYDGSIPKQELRHAYSEYCRLNKLKMCTDKSIKDKLGTLFGAYEKRGEVYEQGRIRCWYGINWKFNIKDEKNNEFNTLNDKVNGLNLSSVQGVQAVRGGSLSSIHACADFSQLGGQVGQVGQNAIAVDTKENFYMVIDFIDEHPHCTLEDLKTLNLFNIEGILNQLKIVGKIFEPRNGVFDIVDRRD